MSVALPALVVGLAAGAVLARGGLCFNRALRRAAFERDPALLTGMLWKAGRGAVALAIAGFAAGELLIRRAGGALITSRLVLEPSPRLRGSERSALLAG